MKISHKYEYPRYLSRGPFSIEDLEDLENENCTSVSRVSGQNSQHRQRLTTNQDTATYMEVPEELPEGETTTEDDDQSEQDRLQSVCDELIPS